ncbi:MAG: CoA ester lyase [Clostridia bacterium]|nr:CoA ester lyase [Clostridia bacterium]
MKQLRRTMLFIPGNNPGMLQSAAIFGADSVILDVEDAVSLPEKDSARILVAKAIEYVDFGNSEVVVRINPLNSPYGLLDIEAIAKVKPDAFLIPKADAVQIQEVSKILDVLEKKHRFEDGAIKLIPLIESAFALETITEVLQSSARNVAVLFGGEDYTADMGIRRTKQGEEIFYGRNRVATACKAFGVDSIDTPFTDVEDQKGLLEDTLKAISLGFTGKAAINPRQVDVIHRAFAPQSHEINYAIRVMEAMEQAKCEGKGVFSLDGKMIDAPIISRASQTLELAKLLGLI